MSQGSATADRREGSGEGPSEQMTRGTGRGSRSREGRGGLQFGGWAAGGLETFLLPSTLGSPAAVPSFFVAVALTNLEDPENARRAYAEAARLDR